MATVNFLTGLLLGCLISAVTSASIKGKEGPIISHPSRFMRIKTVTRVTQIPQSELSSSGRIYPNQSPVLRFDSNLPSPPIALAEQSPITQPKDNGYISPQSGNQEGSHLSNDQTKEDYQGFQVPETLQEQSVGSPGRHSHLPAITNFGARIQKNNQNSKQPGCQVKGGCSTVNFTPDGQISVEGITKVESTFKRDSHSPSVSSHDQQEQFSGQDQPHRQETFGSGQSIDSGDYYDKNSGNSQDEEERKRPEQFPDEKNGGIISNQGSVQNGFQPETQFTDQHDSSDFSNSQNFEGSFQTEEKDTFTGPNKQSTSVSVLPVEQTLVDSGAIYEEQRNFAGNSQFDQSTSQGASYDSPRNFAGNSQFDQSTSQRASYDSQSNFAGNTQFDQSTSQGASYDSQSNFAGNTQFDQSTSQGASYDSQSNFAGNTQFDQSTSQGASYDSQRNFAGNSQFDQSTAQGSFSNDLKPQISGVQSGSFEGGHQNFDDGQYHQYANPIEGLRYNVPGNPGDDYPILYQVPETSFSCKDQPFSAGIFGDTEASCQVFHVCKENGGQDSFLCPNGTVFNQQYFVCDWWYNFRCSDTPSFYNLNNDLYWDWDSFTPSQMLNVPSEDAGNSNLQSGAQDSFGSNEDIRLGTGEIVNQGDAFRSTTAVDNSAIRDENRDIYEQKYEDAFAQEEPVPPSTGNVYQNNRPRVYEQHTNEEYPSSFTSDVGVPTRGLDLTTISPISDSRVENIPEFTRNVNDQNDNSYNPVSSDNGSNRESGGDTGTRYPDQNGHGPQSNKNIQSPDQNRPLSDSQRNLGNSNPNEPVFEGKYDVQEFVSADFDNGNEFRGSNPGSIQNNQNNYGAGSGEGTRSGSNQQIPSGINNNGISYITQTIVQEGSLPNSSELDKPQEFNPSGNINIQRNQETFGTQDQRPISDTNQRDNINQQVVQEEYSSSFGSNSEFPGTRDESYNQQFSQNQGFPFDVNQQSGIRNDQNSNNRNAGDFSNVQQQHISSTLGDNAPDSFQNENSGSFGPQSQNTFTQDHITTSFETGVSKNLGNSRSTTGTNTQQNQGVQQENIPLSFDDQSKAFTSEESYDTSKTLENGQREDSGDFKSSEGVSSNDGNYNTQKIDGNQPLQQEHVSSFSGNSRDSVFRVMDNRGDYEKNGNSQISGQEFSEARSALNGENKNSGNQNVDTRPDIQQEYITSWDNNDPSSFASGENIGSERDVNNQRQTPASFQPNGQSPFNSDGGHQFQNSGGNQEIRQEHVSVPLNGFRQNVIANEGSNVNNNNLQEELLTTLNRGNTVHGNNQHVSFGSTDSVDRNNPQVTEQKQISTHFGENQPTDYQMNKETPEKTQPNPVSREIGGSNSFTIANEDIKQHSLPIPFDGNTRDDFYPGNNRAQNGFISIRDQTNVPAISTVQNNNDRGQNFGSVHFEQNPIIEDQQNEPPVISNENVEYRKTTNNEGNSQNNFGNADFTRDGNPTNIPEVQQEYIVPAFNGPQSNGFDSSGNGRNRIMQNGYIPEQDQRDGENNFRVSINNQQTFSGAINAQQENIPGTFENNHQTNFHTVSTFEQERRQENFSQQNRFVSAGGDQNSFEVGKTNRVHLNPNEVFQTRLNNFRPVQIHMMNRGGFQNRNYDQQRLSFRPYGQNNQNAVIFPGGENPSDFVPNPSLGVKSAFSNERSPSNHNFFVTNGHQLREEHSQLQRGNRPHSSQGPENNIRADNREFGQQNIKISSQEVLNSGPETVDSKNENIAIHQSDVSHTTSNLARFDNRNANSGVKGSSSQNYRNGRNVNTSPSSNVEIDPRGSPISVADVVTYNSPMPESPTSMNYNGWKPVVKY